MVTEQLIYILKHVLNLDQQDSQRLRPLDQQGTNTIVGNCIRNAYCKNTTMVVFAFEARNKRTMLISFPLTLGHHVIG